MNRADVFLPSTKLYAVETGEPLGCLKWQDDVMKEAGGEFLLMHVRFLFLPHIPLISHVYM